jgi:hypothetical protein
MVRELETVWQQFAGTYEAFRRLLAAVPEDRLTWRAGPEATSVAWIVQHVTNTNRSDARMLERGERGEDDDYVENPRRRLLLERLESSEQCVRDAFERMRREDLREFRLDRGHPLGPVEEGPLDAFWFALQVVRHTAYHLGQIKLYLLIWDGEERT